MSGAPAVAVSALPSPSEMAAARDANVERLQAACKTILECLGEDVGREGLAKTPARMAKALLATTAGYLTSPRALVADALFECASREMVRGPLRARRPRCVRTRAPCRHARAPPSPRRPQVLVRDIECNSMCEHHVLPFFGRVHVAYLPQGRVVGISKLARIVDCFGKRLQIQERLTQQIALGVEETTGARGVAVIVECT